MVLLQMASSDLLEADPILAVQHADAELLESYLLLQVEGVVLRRGILTVFLAF